MLKQGLLLCAHWPLPVSRMLNGAAGAAIGASPDGAGLSPVAGEIKDPSSAPPSTLPQATSNNLHQELLNKPNPQNKSISSCLAAETQAVIAAALARARREAALAENVRRYPYRTSNIHRETLTTTIRNRPTSIFWTRCNKTIHTVRIFSYTYNSNASEPVHLHSYKCIGARI